MKLAVLFHRLGPMHHARLTASAALGDVTAIEFTQKDETYAWDHIGSQKVYKSQSLFRHVDSHRVSAIRVRHRMFDVLDDVDPDIVAVPGWSDTGALAALDWGLKKQRNVVIMSDSTEYDKPRVWWKEAIKRRVVSMCSTALVGGKPHIEYVKALGVSEENIFTGYDVVDNTYFFQAAMQVRVSHQRWRKKMKLPRQYFLASSRFVKKKNLFRLLQAYAGYIRKVKSTPWDLVILGDGELWDLLQYKIQELGLEQRVHTPGFKQYAELPAYYGLANAFIHASTTEQWGLVVNEAMASGLPVLVSSRCGCAPDLVVDGTNGHTFEPYAVGEMTDVMIKVHNSGPELMQMGQESLRIISDFTPEVFADQLFHAADTALKSVRPVARLADRPLIWALGGL